MTAKELRALMAPDVTVARLARGIGVSESLVSQFRGGQKPIPRQRSEQIARYFAQREVERANRQLAQRLGEALLAANGQELTP